MRGGSVQDVSRRRKAQWIPIARAVVRTLGIILFQRLVRCVLAFCGNP